MLDAFLIMKTAVSKYPRLKKKIVSNIKSWLILFDLIAKMFGSKFCAKNTENKEWMTEKEHCQKNTGQASTMFALLMKNVWNGKTFPLFFSDCHVEVLF